MSKFSPEYAIAKLKSRMDAEEALSDREDALQCKPGNKPCGKRCIPQDQKCKAEGGGAYNSTAGKIARTAVGVGVGAAALLAYKRSKQGGAKSLAGNPPNRPALPPSRKDSSLSDRLDFFIREDKLQCSAGNKPCGKRCIPEKQNCAVETAKGAAKGGLIGGLLAGPAGAVGGGVYGGMRARGHSKGKSAAFGAAAAIGTIGAAVGAGVANEVRKKGFKEKDETEEAYKTLGVKKGASADEIRAAYKAAAKKYHPDINKDPKATEKLAKINAAMDRLDPRKQAAAKDVKAEKRKGRSDSLSSRVDAFMLFKIQDAYKSIQQDFPEVTQDFWYSR